MPLVRKALIVSFLLLLTIAVTELMAQRSPSISSQSEAVIQVHQATQKEIEPRKYTWTNENWAVLNSAPTLHLIPHTSQGPKGDIWVRSDASGIHIWGQVQVPEEGFHWPRQLSEMMSSDHVEVWLASSADVEMPQIGFGTAEPLGSMTSSDGCTNAFSFGSLQNDPVQVKMLADLIEHCQRWFDEQPEYRTQFKRLFARQWMVAGASPYPFFAMEVPQTSETFASGAWTWMEMNIFPGERPAALKPQSLGAIPQAIEIVREQNPNGLGKMTGYRFHILIPYAAFPPAQQLELADFHLMVDVFRSAQKGSRMGAYSTTSPVRQWGVPASFNTFQLDAPRKFRISPCEYNPVLTDDSGHEGRSWFFPTDQQDLRSVFILANPPDAGQLLQQEMLTRSGDGPYGLSPQVEEKHYFWADAAAQASVCGPELTWQKGSKKQRTSFETDGKYFATQSQPDGWTLVRSGPYLTEQRYRSLPCNWMNFTIYAISPTGEIYHALELKDGMCNRDDLPAAVDLALAPDWKRITLYEEIRDEDSGAKSWQSEVYCLKDHSYELCEKPHADTPPKPPNFPELRNE